MADVAVVIPSNDNTRDESLAGLLDDLKKQTIQPREIAVIRGITPNGRARNAGIGQTTAEYLVFLDDDVRLGSVDVIQKLLEALADPGVGLSGTAQQLPSNSSKFQRECAKQIPRSQSDIVQHTTDSDMVTSQCFATKRSVLAGLGNFHDKILRGVDPELRDRYRKAGLRIVIAPNVWHYHPMPATLTALWKMAFRNGYSSAYAQVNFPDTVLYNPEGHVDRFQARPSLLWRLQARLKTALRAVTLGHWSGLTYDLAYTLGYFQCRLGGVSRHHTA